MLEVEVQNHRAGQLASLKAFLLGFACPPLVAPQAVTSPGGPPICYLCSNLLGPYFGSAGHKTQGTVYLYLQPMSSFSVFLPR